MSKKLNTWTLSGLMIGPILGSGIIFLPPLAYKTLGQHAIWAWIIIMLLGSLFAYIFAKMALQTNSNEGMSIIIGKELGDSYRELASNYLTTAVCFGPIPVVLTASSFLGTYFDQLISSDIYLAYILLILCALIISSGISSVGRIVLILSTVTALLFVSGGIFTIAQVNQIHLPKGLPSIQELGYTLLLIFWSVIGWEIIANYIEDVDNPPKTIMRAMKISLSAIILVYIVTTFALQNYYFDNPTEVHLHVLLSPLFGSWSNIILSVLAACLCICTIIMFVGAVTRQITARAISGQLPKFFSRPYMALIILSTVHILVLTCVALDWINLEWLVSIANTFFISNALLGLYASYRYMKGTWIKIAILLLMCILLILLFFSSFIAWILLFTVTFLSFITKRANKSS